jgi:hypothetical protein
MSSAYPIDPLRDPTATIGEFGIQLPGVLSGLAASIDDSRSLLELPDDWDGEGAAAYSESTWRRTVEFVVRCATALWTDYGIVSDQVRILPDHDGGLAIDWRTGRRELSLSIPAAPSVDARFYGDDGSGGRSFKGSLDPSEPNRWLIAWLAD